MRETTIAELQPASPSCRSRSSRPHRPTTSSSIKYSIPVACFVFALMGLGLGVSIEPRRQAGRLRPRQRRHLRVLHHHVPDAIAGDGRPGPGRPGGVAAEHRARAGRRGHPAAQGPVVGALVPALDSGRRRPERFLPARPDGATAAGRRAGAARARHPASPDPGCRSWASSTAISPQVPAAPGADLRQPARHLLHLDVHRPVRQAVPRVGDARPMARLFLYKTPQFVYFILPLSVLIATLVTVGALTRNSELIVMRACGISLYRAALPLARPGGRVQRAPVRASTSTRSRRRTGRRRTWTTRSGTAGRASSTCSTGGGRRARTATSTTTTSSTRGGGAARVLEIRVRPEGLAALAASPTWRRRDSTKRRVKPDATVGPVERRRGMDPRRWNPEGPSQYATFTSRDVQHGAGRLLRHRAARRGVDDLRRPARLHRQHAGVRPQHAPAARGSPPEDRVPVRHDRHDAARRAVRGDDRPARARSTASASGSSWRSSTGPPTTCSASSGPLGIVTPMLAAWAPNLLFGAGAAYLILTVRT